SVTNNPVCPTSQLMNRSSVRAGPLAVCACSRAPLKTKAAKLNRTRRTRRRTFMWRGGVLDFVGTEPAETGHNKLAAEALVLRGERGAAVAGVVGGGVDVVGQALHGGFA